MLTVLGGIAEFEKDLLGLIRGTIIPQLVINENFRTRACRSCEGFLVPADLNVCHAVAERSRKTHLPTTVEQHEELLGKVRDVCLNAWGEYPQPVSVRLEAGSWITLATAIPQQS